MLDKCAAKEGAKPEDMKDIFEMKSPTTRPGMCVLACMGETLETVMQN